MNTTRYTYEEIVKKFNDCILGRSNAYYPKLALSFDHDGHPVFFVVNQYDDGVLTVERYDYILVAQSLRFMTGLKFAVAKDDQQMPIFAEIHRK